MIRYIFMLSLLLNFLHASELGIKEKLGAMIPLNLKFLNENAKEVTLKELMDGKPTLLTLNYFRCSGICTPQLNDMASVFSKMKLKENVDYRVVTVSFSETETPALAAAKRKNILASITRTFDKDAWHFVIGENNSSGKLAKSVGFGYQKEKLSNGNIEYIHGATLIVLSPEGKITRYLNGINQLPFDVKMALTEASGGKVGPTIAKTLLFCYAYDPKGKTYVFAWEKVVAIVVISITLVFFIWLLRAGKNRDESYQKKGDNDE